MSWQAYVDDSLVGTGHVKKAIILGHDGNVWATTPGFSIKPDEAKKLIAAFNDPSGALSSGVFLASTKYMTLKADNRSVYGKKGATGFCAVKTGLAVLVALYDESIQPGQCATVTEKLADYLIENSY
jgi:profilin